MIFGKTCIIGLHLKSAWHCRNIHWHSFVWDSNFINFMYTIITQLKRCCVLPSLDKNECLQNRGGCHHQCLNTMGGYECKCNAGYSLTKDGRSCQRKFFSTRNLSQCNFQTQLPAIYVINKCLLNVLSGWISSYHTLFIRTYISICV